MKPNKKHGITMRGDSLFCPLPLSIEPYWWCATDCHHCFFRGLNHVWGKEVRPLNLEAFEKKLISGLKNKNPKSPLAYCLSNKKTIRIGNKADPFQDLEKEYLLSTNIMSILRRLKWSFIVQTKYTNNLMELAQSSIYRANKLGLITILVRLTPGLEKDWETFERKRTPSPHERLLHMKQWVKERIPIGVNGEPFIPGFHTLKDFEDTLKALKSIGVNRYNTYSFHFTPYVAKHIANLPGVDIEKIWKLNQDKHWKPILAKLIDLARKHDIILGCPDFVNSGPDHLEQANTCCGIDVPNPTTFNTHYFKQYAQSGWSTKEIEEACWDGSGDLEKGKNIIKGKGDKNTYTLKDAGL